MYLIVVGSTKTYGILFTELDEHYNMGSGPVAIIGSLMFLLMFSSGKITLVSRKPVLGVYVAVKLILRTATRNASMSLENFGYRICTGGMIVPGSDEQLCTGFEHVVK